MKLLSLKMLKYRWKYFNAQIKPIKLIPCKHKKLNLCYNVDENRGLFYKDSDRESFKPKRR